MWRRYLIGNPLYLFRVWRECRGQRKAARRAERPHKLPGNRFGRMRSRFASASRRGQWRYAARVTDVMKRLIDIVVSGALLLMLLPLFGLVALAIRLESPGSVFFRQVRVGCHGKTFAMWKFRSMYVDAEQRKAALEALNEMQGGVIFKLKQDPRITRVGRLIRRLSIDELPAICHLSARGRHCRSRSASTVSTSVVASKPSPASPAPGR